MYAQMLFVTSVRGITFLPQIAAKDSLSFFGAKMPLPAFFIANAIFLPFAFFLRSSALVMVVFLATVVVTVVFVAVFVICDK